MSMLEVGGFDTVEVTVSVERLLALCDREPDPGTGLSPEAAGRSCQSFGQHGDCEPCWWRPTRATAGRRDLPIVREPGNAVRYSLSLSIDELPLPAQFREDAAVRLAALGLSGWCSVRVSLVPAE